MVWSKYCFFVSYLYLLSYDLFMFIILKLILFPFSFFIFDWYFYEGAEYLSDPLQNAFLPAVNNNTKVCLFEKLN
jgi:hypothetical protein